jgi:hypothetical protein
MPATEPVAAEKPAMPAAPVATTPPKPTTVQIADSATLPR